MKIIETVKANVGRLTPIPIMASTIAAGFPSPAEDYAEGMLDLNEHLIKRPSATYFVRVRGDSMIGAGIHQGDLLIVDRSEPITSGRVVVAAVGGELMVKRLIKDRGKIILKSENDNYNEISFENEDELELTIWGVVTAVIHEP